MNTNLVEFSQGTIRSCAFPGGEYMFDIVAGERGKMFINITKEDIHIIIDALSDLLDESAPGVIEQTELEALSEGGVTININIIKENQ